MRTTVAALMLAALSLPYPTDEVLAEKGEHKIYMDAIGNVKASEQGKTGQGTATNTKPKVHSVEPGSVQTTPKQ